RTPWWGRPLLLWGVPVPVGLRSAPPVLPLLPSLLPSSPPLLALSASSPWWGGADTGYARPRAMMFQQLP
ncbi:carboxylate--amine ligase, partial [Mycobacterium tuberculosis]|uniref:glutamate-cysteine ligase family protein n=1 Tax=Mycobacterium tuberculosis TaxID=1773 RepID=UPI000E39E44F